jgi:hypothetical protein
MVLILCSRPLAARADHLAAEEKQYTEHLQEKFLKVYFPPQGPYNYAGSEIKIKIEPDGKAKLERIAKPPLVHGKRNATAELCLRSAVQNVNPLEGPPKGMKLPALLSIKFIRLQNGATIFQCMAKKL